jgi:small subunit ribosomal protein S10
MQALSSTARRAAPFTSARRSAAAPRPTLASTGLRVRDAAAMQQRAVSDAALADIADLENRASEEQGPTGGLPILPSEQVRSICDWRGRQRAPEIEKKGCGPHSGRGHPAIGACSEAWRCLTAPAPRQRLPGVSECVAQWRRRQQRVGAMPAAAAAAAAGVQAAQVEHQQQDRTVRQVQSCGMQAAAQWAAAAGWRTHLLYPTSPVAAPAPPHPQVKLRVRMRGYDISILRDACDQIVAIGRLTGAKIAGPVHLPTKRKIYCVLRSPHVNKDAREHFEVRTHHRLIDLSNLSAQTVEALMEWVPPAGLEVETSIV